MFRSYDNNCFIESIKTYKKAYFLYAHEFVFVLDFFLKEFQNFSGRGSKTLCLTIAGMEDSFILLKNMGAYGPPLSSSYRGLEDPLVLPSALSPTWHSSPF